MPASMLGFLILLLASISEEASWRSIAAATTQNPITPNNRYPQSNAKRGCPSCLSVHSSVVDPFVRRCGRRSVRPFVRQSVHQYGRPSVLSSVRPPVRSSVRSFVRLSVSPPVRQSVRPYFRPPVYSFPFVLDCLFSSFTELCTTCVISVVEKQTHVRW